MQCPQCSKETPHGSLVCPFCATPLDEAVTSMPTPPAEGDAPSSPLSHSDSGQHGRFLPGTTVAERYRIVGLLGRGGMGEVYRADDLKLGQQVALKFLSSKIASDPAQVEFLFDEVRMARKVSHPNVCRVWDVGEAEGHHYVSMEYVDGEDLASLLRRIGRLPEDKAVEISRQLCAALAAAHDEGVLHRDLKPANIMLDGRGRVKLTDFGLAAVAEVRAGTPIYMAPEQLEGKEVSVKSDLYALGLVLHELFTGKRVFDAADLESLTQQHKSSPMMSRTSTAGLDPAIDRVIGRCLEVDPAKRPDSALAVAAGLPGADPLAAALAAGETPSPEMVAEAGGEGSLSIAIALPLLLATLGLALTVGVVQTGVSLINQVPFDTAPLLMEDRAREIVEELGYPTDYADSASSFAADLGYINWLRNEGVAEERWDVVEGGRPASITFWWRSSPSVLVPSNSGVSPGQPVSLGNPARAIPGMLSLQIDTLGRLLWLDVVPDRLGDPATQGGEVDWAQLFELMGLDIVDFTTVEPRLSPAHFADARAAWEGAYPEDPEVTLRVEAAAFAGKPTGLRLFTPYDPLEPPPRSSPNPGITAVSLAISILFLVIGLSFLTVVFGGLYVAQRNVRTGRGDRRGARRLGFGMAVAMGLVWLLGEHTVSGSDVGDFMGMLVFVGAIGGISWALYLAIEPFMRRHAPEALIGWTRFIDGRLADPLVGRDILMGCGAGALSRLLDVVPIALSEPGATVGNYVGLPPSSVTDLVGTLVTSATLAVMLGLGVSFLYGLTFVGLRRRAWAAYAVWLTLFGGLGFLPGVTVNGLRPAATTLSSVFWVIAWALWLFVLFRMGLLMFVVMASTSSLLAAALPTLSLSAWYGSSVAAGLLIFVGLSGYAFYRCTAWKGGLAEALVGE